MNFEIKINKEHQGIELIFQEKPITELLLVLKANGFRWHRIKKLWYAKENETRTELVNKLKSSTNEDIIYLSKNLPNDLNTKMNTSKPKVNKYGVKIGDVFYDSWGYEQTNIDFYQVVDLKGSTTVVLRPVNKKYRSIGYCSDMVTPIKDDFKQGKYKTRLLSNGEETISKRVREFGSGNIVVGSECLYPTTWDSEHNETSYY